MSRRDYGSGYGRGFDHGYWTAILGITAYIAAATAAANLVQWHKDRKAARDGR